jgi:hypothetical protein
MNKEQQELLDDAYESYVSTHENFEWTDDFCKKNLKDYGDQWDVFSKVEFINKCKTDKEFSERWGLKIEERELTYSERYKIWFTNNFETGMEYCEDVKPDFDNEYYEPTPTKLITVTYNDKTIKSYE